MIYFLTTPQNADTIRVYLKVAGADIAGRLVPMVYEELFAAPALPDGTYCFADLELLTEAQRGRAARHWQELAARGCRLLNHPTRSLLRFELLQELRRRGVNTFGSTGSPMASRPSASRSSSVRSTTTRAASRRCSARPRSSAPPPRRCA
jgi:hypothetical protein